MWKQSTLLRSWKVPETGHATTAKLKWATYTFWYVLDPMFRRHFSYYQKKVQLDRFLEKNSIWTNCGIGVLLGATAYFTVIHMMLPPAAGAREHTMKENMEEIFYLMNADTTKELPAFQLMRIKREVIGKLLAVTDEAEVRRQRNEVQELQRMLSEIDARQPSNN